MYYDQPKDVSFDIESSPPEKEAQNAEEILNVEESNDEVLKSTRVQWADPISTTTVIEPKAG